MTTKSEIQQRLDQATIELEKTKSHDPKKHKDETRSKIALFVVKSFFYLIGGTLFFLPIYNQVANPGLQLSLVDTISMLSGVISGPFGFVVGYYFKGSEAD